MHLYGVEVHPNIFGLGIERQTPHPQDNCHIDLIFYS